MELFNLIGRKEAWWRSAFDGVADSGELIEGLCLGSEVRLMGSHCRCVDSLPSCVWVSQEFSERQLYCFGGRKGVWKGVARDCEPTTGTDFCFWMPLNTRRFNCLEGGSHYSLCIVLCSIEKHQKSKRKVNNEDDNKRSTAWQHITSYYTNTKSNTKSAVTLDCWLLQPRLSHFNHLITLPAKSQDHLTSQ